MPPHQYLYQDTVSSRTDTKAPQVGTPNKANEAPCPHEVGSSLQDPPGYQLSISWSWGIIDNYYYFSFISHHIGLTQVFGISWIASCNT